jgi:gentisate 1,2-dioxygenase
VVWLDGLDIPLVRFLDAGFLERHPEEVHPETRPPGDNNARYGANLLPVGYRAPAGRSPLFSYPYARSREALERMRRWEEWDPHHGLKMAFINPADGGPAMGTMSTFIQLLPAGFATAPCRSTDGAVVSVVEGRGETRVETTGGGATLAWEPGDTFVVPSWQTHTHTAREEAVLFSFSDRVVQEKLGLWREERG